MKLVYLDTSLLVRAYLPDEPDHALALRLLGDGESLLVTSSWSWVEATSAIVRAGAAGRCDPALTLPVLDGDLSSDGAITLLAPDQEDLEAETIAIGKTHALRSLDALHLACAVLAAVPLLDPRQRLTFASRDRDQATAAASMGFTLL